MQICVTPLIEPQEENKTLGGTISGYHMDKLNNNNKKTVQTDADEKPPGSRT
jgi:hypothetical protein